MSGTQNDIFDAIKATKPADAPKQHTSEPVPTMNNADITPQGAPYAEPTEPSAYAQRAIFRLMSGGEWYTIRQISELCKLSDPRGNIRTMKKRGYMFEWRIDYNEHHIRYKWWRLIIPEKGGEE